MFYLTCVAKHAKHMCISRLAENIACNIEYIWWTSIVRAIPIYKITKIVYYYCMFMVFSRYTSLLHKQNDNQTLLTMEMNINYTNSKSVNYSLWWWCKIVTSVSGRSWIGVCGGVKSKSNKLIFAATLLSM